MRKILLKILLILVGYNTSFCQGQEKPEYMTVPVPGTTVDSVPSYIKANIINPRTQYEVHELVGKIYKSKHPPNRKSFCGKGFSRESQSWRFSVEYSCDQSRSFHKYESGLDLFLIKMIYTDNNNNRYKQIINVVTLDTMEIGEIFFMSGRQIVEKNRKYLEDVIGITQADETGNNRKVSRAWRPNFETGELIPISVDSLICRLH